MGKNNFLAYCKVDSIDSPKPFLLTSGLRPKAMHKTVETVPKNIPYECQVTFRTNVF